MSAPREDDDGPDATGLRLTQAADRVSLASEADAEPARPLDGTRLKIVTVSPGSDRNAFSDAELATGARKLRQDPYLGATIDGRYQVEAVLGEGGMGVVYRCSHTIIGKKVAMKVLRADLARDSEVTERFLNEAKAASAIGNPHIIDISDFGQFPDGSTYFIMEYLTGLPLSKVLEGGRGVPESRILHIARQLAEGLAAAHDAGIVHRDLKPDNIFLVDRGAERDFVKILDFGIAKVSTSEAARLTRAGAVFGTPHYMSPEQAAGGPIDHRGDIYALGVILYEMSTGRVPFDGDNFMAILSQHVNKTPLPLRSTDPAFDEVPAGLEAIVLKCLSKLPDQRYATMLDLLQDLDALSLGSTPGAVAEIAARPSSKPPASKGSGLGWKLAAVAGGAVASVAIVVAVVSGPSGAARTAPAEARRPVVEAPAPSPRTQQVVIATNPLDARVFRGGADLGASPVMLELGEGERVELTIRREGYADKTLGVDARMPRHAVTLEPLPRSEAARPAPPRSRTVAERRPERRPSGGAGSNGIVNPWAKR